MDFAAVHYMIVRSLKLVLFISFPISVLFFIYPQILLSLFNVVHPYHVELVTLAIRITAFLLVGRCMSYLLANYAQAIEKNKIASVITFVEEFLFIVVGALILTRIVGGIGIWISILIGECLPVVVYVLYTLRLQRNYKDTFDRILMIQNSKLVTWTYNRNDVGTVDKYFDEQSRETLVCIEKTFKDDAIVLSNSIKDVCDDIFENCDIDDIDLTIRLMDEKIYIVLTNEGILYNPFSNANLMESDNMRTLSELECEFDYDEILGFNKSYIIHEV